MRSEILHWTLNGTIDKHSSKVFNRAAMGFASSRMS